MGGYFVAGASLTLDAVYFYNGDISATRFGYRSAVTTIGLGIAYFGSGGWGALATGLGILGEHAYDAAKQIGGESSRAFWEAENAMKRGWRPVR